jgi:hypothetical protein
LPKDAQSGKGRSFGFVKFETAEEVRLTRCCGTGRSDVICHASCDVTIISHGAMTPGFRTGHGGGGGDRWQEVQGSDAASQCGAKARCTRRRCSWGRHPGAMPPRQHSSCASLGFTQFAAVHVFAGEGLQGQPRRWCAVRRRRRGCRRPQVHPRTALAALPALTALTALTALILEYLH